MKSKLKKCILCEKLTLGSIGAAGIKYSFICQQCKNNEDKVLAERIMYQGKTLDKLFELIK